MNHTKEQANHHIKNEKDSVNKKQRHLFHLMPEIGWMNDPNGVVYFKGYYHLFYQFYPYDAKWGAMHWGHARTKDFMSYEHLPVALAPDLDHEDGCFSGGATVYDNKLLLMYTSHYQKAYQKQEQSLAISKDGITFEKVNNKPVITIEDLPTDASKTDFRDPNPIEIDQKHFVLIGSSDLQNKGQILIYQTEDFKTYTYLNAIKHPLFGDIAECPDLFELDGKHVLLFSSTNLKECDGRFKNVNSSLYAIGSFDSNKGEFKFEHVDELDAGHHYYAPQTLKDDSNRRISIAWMEMWGKDYYTAINNHKWTGALTLPRTLNIVNHKLIQTPAFLENLTYLNERKVTNQALETKKHFHLSGVTDTKEALEVIIGDEDDFVSLRINCQNVTLDTSHTKLFPLESRSVAHQLELVSFDLIMDNSSLELFIKDLDKTITTRVYFDKEELNIKMNQTSSNEIVIKELSL
ncbi:MAG: GH32 C-terminal domain-containing protein [Acholeplasma sp.]|nr:GH32 C-terminal domain-containing protein [Acholeplasma sp.]